MYNTCTDQNTTLIPLSKVVSAAIVDTGSEIGAVEQTYSHWAAREIKKLMRQTLRVGKRYVTLNVNKNTYTATLPADFGQEMFIGYLDAHGTKIPIPLRPELTNSASIKDIPCDDACPKCSQSKSICSDLTVTESTEQVIVDGNNYTKTIIKKFYSNGNYYLETTIPYYNFVTETVEYTTTKEFITELDLKDCGCLETTTENLEKVRACCPDVYNSYYNGCSAACDTGTGGYRILEELGLIQLSRKFTPDKLYVEYTGFLPKVNGQLAIPEVAFETAVAGVKLRAIQDKKNVNLGEKQFQFNMYRTVRGNMNKELGRIGIDNILQAAALMPKFDIGYDFNIDSCGTSPVVTALVSSVAPSVCEVISNTCNTGNGTKHITPFQLSVIAGNGGGNPVVDAFSWQNNGLIGAINVNYILVNNNNESADRGDFTFDSATGTLTRINPFQVGDVIIIPFAKLV